MAHINNIQQTAVVYKLSIAYSWQSLIGWSVPLYGSKCTKTEVSVKVNMYISKVRGLGYLSNLCQAAVYVTLP